MFAVHEKPTQIARLSKVPVGILGGIGQITRKSTPPDWIVWKYQIDDETKAHGAIETVWYRGDCEKGFGFPILAMSIVFGTMPGYIR